MVLQDLGGVIFFTDPLFSHPHAADIATLLRMCDLHNILCTPATPPRPGLSSRCCASDARARTARSVTAKKGPCKYYVNTLYATPCSLYIPPPLWSDTFGSLGALSPYVLGELCNVQLVLTCTQHSRRNMQ